MTTLATSACEMPFAVTRTRTSRVLTRSIEPATPGCVVPGIQLTCHVIPVTFAGTLKSYRATAREEGFTQRTTRSVTCAPARIVHPAEIERPEVAVATCVWPEYVAGRSAAVALGATSMQAAIEAMMVPRTTGPPRKTAGEPHHRRRRRPLSSPERVARE